MIKEYHLLVERDPVSHDFILEEDTGNIYKNRTKNNMIDHMFLYKNDVIIWSTHHLQTVSNHPLMKYSDTIQKGNFKLKLFVEQRKFNTPVHGIIDAFDLNGDYIDEFSMQKDQGEYIGRFLMHSSYYAPLKRDTKGYSGACFIVSTAEMLAFNKVLLENGLKEGDILKGVLRSAQN